MFDIVAYRKTYYRKNKGAIRERNRLHYLENKDRINERNRKLYLVNREEYSKTRRNWRDNNKDKLTDIVRAWKRTLDGYLRDKLNRLRTRTKGIVDCDLTFEQLRKLYLRQDSLCVLTGRKMCLLGIHSLDSLSIDRKNQRKGYTIRNVRLVTWQANSARNSGTDVQLVSFCQDVVKYAKAKKRKSL